MSNRTYHPRGLPVDGFAVQQHPLYPVWANMLGRCTNPDATGYSNYGGRGISVCERWYNFRFFAKDMMPTYKPGLWIERMDVHGNYSPENCTWETPSNQCVNRRRFKNNTSGQTGVVTKDGLWLARFDYNGVRYNIGWFGKKEDAIAARLTFVENFFLDRDGALASLQIDKARSNSSTGLMGVTPHLDGGYTARATKNGVRHYLGLFKTKQEAFDARSKFIAG